MIGTCHAVHAVVISWTGHGARAQHIASGLAGHADRITVIYSNPTGAPESGAGDWVQVDNALFFGPKLAAGMARHGAEEFLVLIQADATAKDWPGVIRALRDCAAVRPALGVWTPVIDTSFYHARCLTVATTSDPRYEHACQTDGIVLALHRDIILRLRELDLAANNLGWGIDKFANSVALALGREIILDRSLTVGHVPGRSYDPSRATAQMDAFLAQMTERERVLHRLLEDSFYAINRRQKRRSGLVGFLRRVRGA